MIENNKKDEKKKRRKKKTKLALINKSTFPDPASDFGYLDIAYRAIYTGHL